MIDLHNHILPAIDDGAKDWQEAIEMARSAEKNGINTIVATPHYQKGIYETPKRDVIDLTEELNQKLRKENIQVNIFPGHEAKIYGNFIEDLKKENFLTLNNTNKYVYVELPFQEVPKYTDQLIFELQLEGFIPVIPHPERNQAIQANPEKIYQLVKSGAITQITTGSILGLFGKEVHKFTLELLDADLVHLLATDAHKATGSRGLNLGEAFKALEQLIGSIHIEQIKSNADNVLNGRDIYVPMPRRITRRKKRFGLF